MTLIQVSIDPIVVEEILIGTIGAIASVVGAIAVMKAVPRAQGSPTQAEQGGFRSIRAAVDDRGCAGKASDPLNLRFTLPDPDVTLLRIELANQLDKGAGTAQCVKEAPQEFLSRRWSPRSSNAGITPIHIGRERRSSSQFECLLSPTGRQGAKQYGPR